MKRPSSTRRGSSLVRPPNTRRARPATPGFTLIEVSVVVVLLTLLIGIATARLKGPYDLAKQQFDRRRIVFVDALARSYARRHQTATKLHFDVDAGQIELVVGPVGKTKQLDKLVLGGGLRLTRVLTADRESLLGRKTIAVGQHGQSESYALNLKDTSGKSEWTVVLGLTGQRVTLENQHEVQTLFRTLAANGTNAN